MLISGHLLPRTVTLSCFYPSCGDRQSRDTGTSTTPTRTTGSAANSSLRDTAIRAETSRYDQTQVNTF